LNTYYGNGSALSTDPGGNSNNFGVGLVGASNDNIVERNKIGGNLNGVYIDSSGDVGNVIRRNIIAGNPPGQLSLPPPLGFGDTIGKDIQDMSAPGTNTFEDNFCLTYAGLLAPAPCPNFSKPLIDADSQAWDVAAFERNRLAFPQAWLVDAVFRPSPRPVLSTAAFAQPPQTADLKSVSVTGRVVDAACYMLHAAAATKSSHMDCGAACLARGAPLAIATDDGTLYFPVDGNVQLKPLFMARVRASGTVVEKREPMELKMPVGEKNQMVVRLEGGYNQITLRTVEKAPVAAP
jgi:hypothetical protein